MAKNNGKIKVILELEETKLNEKQNRELTSSLRNYLNLLELKENKKPLLEMKDGIQYRWTVLSVKQKKPK